MATSFAAVRPAAIKLKAQLRYPASFVGQDSLVTALAHGTVTVSSNYAALTPTGGVLSPSTAYFKGWDSVNGGYFRVSYSEITAGSVSAANAASASASAASTSAANALASYNAAAALVSTGVLDVTAGTGGITVTGSTRHPIINAISVRGENLLPNTNWLLTTKIAGVTASASVMKPDGTALTTPISVTSFTTSSGAPVFNTANTQDLFIGSYVVFGAGLGGLSGWALPVTGVATNSAFSVSIPFNKASPASSSAITAYMCGISSSAANTYTVDHWAKATTLAFWVDDFAINACPGAVRVLGLRKGSSSAEVFNCTSAGNYSVQSWTERLRGKTVTLGALVRCKVGGTGTKLIINDYLAGGGNNVTYSSAVTGTSFVDASYNNYEFLQVTATISATSLHVDVGIETNGALSDIIYFACPTLKFGSFMTKDDLGAPKNEIVPAETHWNPPCTVPFSSTTPSVELITGSGLYGWMGISLEAISYGQCHHSVIKANCKIELTTPTVGADVFIAALDSNPQLVFGQQAITQVANITVATNMTWLPLKKTGAIPGTFAVFCNNASQVLSNITFDFDDVMGS